jgi:hypothetical protein
MGFTMRSSSHHEPGSPSIAPPRSPGPRASRFTASRRSARVAGLGGVLTVLVVATFSPRLHAAGKERDAAPYGASATRAQGFGLLPLFAKRDVPLFGSFIKPGGSPDAVSGDATCPADMTEVEGEYCPFVEQRCLRWLDPATKLQCAEFDRASMQTMGARC